jgi:hypothetical protein
MTIVINKKASSNQIELARKKVLKSKPKRQGVAKLFGALKRNIDGVKYQKAVRNEWD